MSKRRAKAKEEWTAIPFPTRVISGGEPEEPHKADPPKALTQEEALEVLWSAKSAFLLDDAGTPRKGDDGHFLQNPHWCDAFVYATLQRDLDVWRGERNEKKPVRVIPKGTRVLVCVVSRFGHVGIRDQHLVPASNGYCATCQPEDLTDWNMAP